MEKVHRRANTVVVVVAVAVVLWVSTHRAIDFFAPAASTQLANHSIVRMLPAVAAADSDVDGDVDGADFDEDGDVDGNDFLRVRGRVIVDETSRLAGDWNGDGFDILSFRHGLARPVDGEGPAFDDLVFTKRIGRSSSELAAAVAEGRVFPKIEIELTFNYDGAGLLPYLRYELTDVRVTSYDIGRSGQSEGRLVEEIVVVYEHIKWVYTEYDQSGSPTGETEFSWKVEKGR